MFYQGNFQLITQQLMDKIMRAKQMVFIVFIKSFLQLFAFYYFQLNSQPNYQISLSLFIIINLYNFNKMDWVNHFSKISNKVKFQLFGRGYENLDHLYNKLPQYDTQSTGVMTEHAFNLCLNASGIFLTKQQIRIVKDCFPKDHGIGFWEFLGTIRSDITQKRMATIDHSFDIMSNGTEQVEWKDFIGRFNAKKHPHVRSLTKNQEQVTNDVHKNFKRWSEDGKCLKVNQFKQYFMDVNSCIPLEREEFFVDLILYSFSLMDDRVSLERLKQLQVTVFEKVRQRTYLKKDEGSKSHAVFKYIDLQEKGKVNFKRFVDVLDKLGCKFSDKENKALFLKHSGQDQILSYEEMCGLLFDMGSGNKDNVNPIYQFAKSDGGYVTTPGMTNKLHQ